MNVTRFEEVCATPHIGLTFTWGERNCSLRVTDVTPTHVTFSTTVATFSNTYSVPHERWKNVTMERFRKYTITEVDTHARTTSND